MKCHIIVIFSIVSALVCVASSPRAQRTGQEVRQLDPAKPLVSSLKGGEAHLYAILLEAGHILDLVVEQDGIDVEVRLFAPGGAQLIEMDSPNGTKGPEPVLAIAGTGGLHRLEVRSSDKKASAGNYEVKIIALRPAAGNDRAMAEIFNSFNQSVSLRNQRKYEEAVPLAERALAMRDEVPGLTHPVIAAAIEHLAFLYRRLATNHFRQGELKKAEPLFQQLLDLRTRTSEATDPDVVTSLNYLATIHHERGVYARARPLYLRALEALKTRSEQDTPNAATVLHNLAAGARQMGDYALAETWCRRALRIRQERLGDESKEVADALNELGAIHHYRGDYDLAESHYKQALAVWERALGDDHPHVATALHNLAAFDRERRNHAKAEAHYLKAIEIRERKPGLERRDLAESLNGLGAVHHDQRRFAEAEQFYRRALRIGEEALGGDHPGLASVLNNLGVLAYDRGDYSEAEALYRRAMEITERSLGPEHPDAALWLYNLAVLCRVRGDAPAAVSNLARAGEIRENDLGRNLLAGSERQKLAYLSLFAVETNEALSLHLRDAPGDPQALDLAVTTLLRRKGRALDAMTDSFARVRRRASAADQALLDQLQALWAELAALSLRGHQGDDATTYRARLRQLEEEADRLEARIGATNVEFRLEAKPVTLAAVQSLLPPETALVEFILYTPREAKSREHSNPRYAAYVLSGEGSPRWVDLGEAAAIDLHVAELRQALRDPFRADVRQRARAADEKVMRPVRALIAREQRHVLIAPDGQLNLIPFAALVDEQDRYLIARYSFTYLTSGRDLLRLQSPRASRSGPLIVADPAFGEEPGSPVENQGRSLPFFRRLRGSAREAQALRAILPKATILTGEQATETALKRVSGPSILQLATHGFFLEDQLRPARAPDLALAAAAARSEPLPRGPGMGNPLLRSGLALAGANVRRGGEDDGVLTALEAAGLDLWGARLVVLSACDSGVGAVKNGEGVYGLRRALALAGAESQIMSLWPVRDATARDWMTSYYTLLQAGRGRGEAARETQLRMFGNKLRRHPFYWASFIQAGEWANLNGRR
jgi:CHAT domain-containing protein/Tfp pilus assembly protein PilF